MTTNSTRSKPKVLFVDDEARLLEGLAQLLRKDYDVHLATSGADALQKLRDIKDVSVVVSDFRMPQMDGATFLHEVMARAPQATRILLTGEAGLEGAKDAVNKGQIFRFLTKPCPQDQLKAALDAGIDHHRLLNAERTVMQETLLECIAALMEVLAVTNPVAFGRAQRLKGLVAQIAGRLGMGQFWQLEAAALLSQIGYFAETPALAEKIYYGRPLTPAEQERAKVVPATGSKLLEHIPRLEPVIQILAALEWPDASVARLGEGTIGLGTRILCVALEYDVMDMQDLPKADILEKLKSREARFGTKVLEAFQACIGLTDEAVAEIVVPLRDAKPGMRLRQEIRSQVGALLVPFGFEISQRLLERLSQVAPETLEQPVRLAPARS
ncbi:MAG TPA: response regulator [Steroidobacteraceae bacterium]|nr:response regulator [Steroidobacteraceae bacterium]